MGVFAGINEKARDEYRKEGFRVLLNACPTEQQDTLRKLLNKKLTDFNAVVSSQIKIEDKDMFGIHPFFIKCGEYEIPKPQYSLQGKVPL